MNDHSAEHSQASISLDQPQLRVPTLSSTTSAVHLLLDPINAATCIGVCADWALHIDILDLDILAYGRARTDQIPNQR
jgi:hypothetical protein